MNRDDILKMLDIKDKPAPSKVDPVEVTEGKTKTKLITTSDTALLTDEWDRDKGRSLALHDLADPHAWTDFHALAYQEDPTLAEACTDPRRAAFVDQLLNTPQVQALRVTTTLNEAESDIAAKQFATEWVKLKAKDQQEEHKKPSKAKDRQQQRRLIQAANKAAKAAQEEVEEFREDMEMLAGAGVNPSQNPSNLDPAALARLFARIRNSWMLKRIMERVGRFYRVARSKQRQKTGHGYDDIVGVEMGGEINKLVPLELALLADDDFELDSMRRITENQAMIRAHRGLEYKGRGPLVIVVDETGSMIGEKIVNAKALTLALARIAKQQNRWCLLVGDSGYLNYNLHAVRPNQREDERLLTWLEHMFNGGCTTHLVTLTKLEEDIWPAAKPPAGKTDIVLLTDGQAAISSQTLDQFTKFKERVNAKLHTLIIQHSDAGDLAKVSDEVNYISRIEPDEKGLENILAL